MTTRHQLLVETGPFKVTDFRCHLNDDHHSQTGCAMGWDIVLVRRGAFVTRRRSRETLAFAGRALLVSPDQEFSVEHPFGDDEGIVFTLQDPEAESIEPARLRALFSRGQIDVASSLLLRQKFLLQQAQDPLSATTVAVELLGEILGPSLPADSGSRNRDAATIAAEILRARFADSMTLPQLAAAIGVSSFHLARLFRKRFGESIHRYRNTVRMIAAVKRLEKGEQDLARLALELGYSDHSHFAAAFRKYFGVSPSAFRRRVSQRARFS